MDQRSLTDRKAKKQEGLLSEKLHPGRKKVFVSFACAISIGGKPEKWKKEEKH